MQHKRTEASRRFPVSISMPLVLTVASYRNQLPPQPLVRRFDGPTVSIGRAPENDWVLPDPEFHLSKRHCVIRLQGGQYTITDISTNGVFVNGSPQPLGNGQSAPLHDGDRLVMGDYEMTVQIGAAVPQSAPAPHQPTPVLPPAGTPDDPFGLDALSARPVPPPLPPSPAPSPVPPLGFDPFAPLGGPPEPPSAGTPGWLLDGPFGNVPPGPPPFTPPDHARAEDAFFRPPSPIPSVIPDNWMDGGSGVGFPGQGSAFPAREPPAPVPQAPAPRAPMPPPTYAAEPAAPAADSAALLRAFLTGAGLAPEALHAEDAAAVMRAVGQILREMVSGLRDVLAVRAQIKTEYRVERTVIHATDNNPLKFAVDVEETLALLLGRPRPGYIGGAQAVQEGFKDIKAHELALLAGMQTAVSALLRQFDPEHLKQRMDRRSFSLLPGARQARYWSLYEEQYRQIAAEISEDVRGTFGAAFAAAYEDQSRKL